VATIRSRESTGSRKATTSSKRALPGRISGLSPPRGGVSRPDSRSGAKAVMGAEWVASKGYKRVKATDAKNRFGSILKQIETNEPVFIDKHENLYAVVLNYQSYCALVEKAREPHDVQLDSLRDEFERMYAAMQGPKTRAGVDALLIASADELNKVAAARHKTRG
jgi:hypothetical protein